MSNGVAISSTLIRERSPPVTSRAPPRPWAARTGSRAWSSAATSGAGLLGFPTANVESPPHTAIPADGVYAGWLQCIRRHLAATRASAGRRRSPSARTRPSRGVPRTVEAYALDRDDLDLYGAHVAVDFAARLRGNARFDSIEALIAQIHADVDQVRRLTT